MLSGPASVILARSEVCGVIDTFPEPANPSAPERVSFLACSNAAL
jgi:hypothetical protein